MPKNLNHPPIYFDLSPACWDGHMLQHPVELHFSLSDEIAAEWRMQIPIIQISIMFFWLIKIKCMRIGHIISEHDTDDPEIGRNSRFSSVTDDVEHTIFGRKIRISGCFLRPKRP